MNPLNSTPSGTQASIDQTATTLSRRRFLANNARAVAATSLIAAAPWVTNRPVLGANDRIGVGFIGTGGRGMNHVATVVGMINQNENLEAVAVCDAYGPRLEAAAAHAKAKPYRKHHELLADKAVDAVCVATPDRLHVPQALDAIRAGKDVYCEKPMGHWSQFDLSRKFYLETQELKRVVQIGNQGNSNKAWKQVAALIQKGAIGRPQLVQAGYYRRGDWGERMTIPDKNAKPGPGLDWEAFLGDAPVKPFSVERFFSWRMFLDYAGGPCTDLFPHVFTPFVSLFGLKFPSYVVASGGIFKFDDYGREVPDTFSMSLDYPERLTVALVCTLTNEFATEPAIRGDEGTITMQGPAFEGGFDSVTLIPKSGEKTVIAGEKPNTTLLHWKNFLECIRSRAKPVSDVEFGFHVQAALCMAMLSYLERKVAKFDLEKKAIVLV